MGEVLLFPRQSYDATAIGYLPAGARIVSVADGQESATARTITGNGVTIFYEMVRDEPADIVQFAMDDDTAPSEANPDPFLADMDHRDD